MPEIMVREIKEADNEIHLYGEDPEFYVIANSDDGVKVGDVIEYGESKENFGWFVSFIKL